MKKILWFAVTAIVLQCCSLSKIHNRAGKRAPHKTQDDENFVVIENILKPNKPKKMSPPCETNECYKQSWRMARMMDPTADPCSDFYQYACGGWLKKKMPPDQVKWTVFAWMANKTETRLREVIENQKNSDSKVARMVYDWYAACVNQAERDRLGASPLQQLIQKAIGAEFSPWVDIDGVGKDWSLEETLALVHRKIGVTPLFKVSLDIDPTNSSSPTHLTLTVPDPLLSIPELYTSRGGHFQVVYKAYVTLMIRLMVLLNVQEKFTEDQFSNVLKKMLYFEIELAQEIKREQSNKNGEGVPLWTIKDLQENLPDFDWERYFSVLLDGISNDTVLETETMFIGTPGYLKNIISILKKTDKGTIANFLVWNIIFKYGPYLSTAFHDEYLNFYRQAYGVKKSSPLWKRCVRSADSSLDMGVSMLFIKDIGVTNESLYHANQMVQMIRQEFLDNLNSVTWMDDVTKNAARIKAKAMYQQIGYPKFILNETLLELYFDGLEVDPNTFFTNRLNEISLRMKNTLLMRGQPLDPDSWDMNPDEINAYYSPNNNKIVVPEGILRPPFYDSQYPPALNFGAIGFVVGHELTHGFDTNGAMFDEHGNLANWWTKNSFKNFVVREMCLVEEYDQCEVRGHQLSGRRTLGENTADNGGLKLAYMAYHSWLEKHDNDTILPKLGLTSDQLFFLSFAQIWCEKSTPDYALSDLATNVHSPGRFRVDVTLANSPVFAQAYNCPYGTNMNPVLKCAVW